MFRILFAAVVLAGIGSVQTVFGQYGDSLRGASLLRERGCSSCHAVLGRGGGIASDLTTHGAGVFSPAAFAAEVWNHAPEMWAEMDREGRQRPALSAQDMKDVFAFLYSVRYFEPTGDIDRGRRVFVSKKCHNCHGLVRVEGGGIGPAAPDWPSLTEPVRFLEAMWNHGAAMDEETNIDGIPWPSLTTRELADLIAFVYNLPDRPPRMGRLELGSPNAGMKLFDDLGCIECHTILDTNPDLVPLAPQPGRHYTITELAVAMWNHQPIMQEWAEATGKEIPRLESGQMGQILSYLMDEGFLDRSGNEKRGARLFESRGCQGCHSEGGRALPKRDWDAAKMTAAVWSHGEAMRTAMQGRGRDWPTLSAEDMADLIAWMNARQ
jgi:mono/diheme cytochrome c family protein